MGRHTGIWPEIPEEFAGRLALLDIRIDDEPLELPNSMADYGREEGYYEQHPFSADRWDGTQWVYLCEPNDGPKRTWEIVTFRTLEQCCRAALNAKKHGYDWDNGD